MYVFDTSIVTKAARNNNAYTLDLWKDPAKDRLAPDNTNRLLAVTFDLELGRFAFAAAVRRFPGREITLRERARIILTSERQEHLEWARLLLGADEPITFASAPAPHSR